MSALWVVLRQSEARDTQDIVNLLYGGFSATLLLYLKWEIKGLKDLCLLFLGRPKLNQVSCMLPHLLIPVLFTFIIFEFISPPIPKGEGKHSGTHPKIGLVTWAKRSPEIQHVRLKKPLSLISFKAGALFQHVRKENSNINRERETKTGIKKIISQAIKPSCDWGEKQVRFRLGARFSGARVNSQNLILLDLLLISLVYSSDGDSFIETHILYTAYYKSLSP